MVSRAVLSFSILIISIFAYGESDFNLSFTNENETFDFPSEPGFFYDNRKILNFDSIQSKIPSSSIQINSYGTPGQLNTVSLDGGSSEHTRTALNGLVIDNGQNNVMDLSILPLEFADSADIYKNNMTPFGVDAPAGLINFNLFPPENMSYISLYGGSFYSYGGKVYLDLDTNDCRFIIGAAYESASNNFSYVDQYSNLYIASNLDYQKISLIGRIETPAFNLILTHTGKEEGTGTTYGDFGREDDYFSTADLSSSLSGINMDINYINWFNEYMSPLTGSSTNINNTAGASVGKKFDFGPLTSALKIIDKDFMLNSSVIGYKNADQVDIDLVNRLTLGRFEAGLAADETYRTDLDFFFTPEASLSYKLMDGLLIQGNISTLLNLPTFNDLYWPQEGGAIGNPNLLPETGWKWQGGVLYTLFPFILTLTYSENYYSNLILWEVNESGVWSPQNISSMFSRVASASIDFNEIYGDFHFSASYSFSYNYSINNDPSSQYYLYRIIYTPLYKNSFYASVIYKNNYELSVTSRSVSERFITPDNSEWLPPYTIVSCYLRVYIVFFEIENIFDESYEEVSGYPEMGRYIRGGITIKF